MLACGSSVSSCSTWLGVGSGLGLRLGLGLGLGFVEHRVVAEVLQPEVLQRGAQLPVVELSRVVLVVLLKGGRHRGGVGMHPRVRRGRAGWPPPLARPPGRHWLRSRHRVGVDGGVGADRCGAERVAGVTWLG